MKEQQCSHRMISLMAMATMVLHNVCMVHNHGDGTPDIEIPEVDLLESMQKCPFNKCPECIANNVIHCVHLTRGKLTSKRTDMTHYRLELSKQLWARKVQNDLGQ